MPSRTLAGTLGLKGDWPEGEDGWKDEMDTNLLTISVLSQGSFISKEAATPGAPTEGDVYVFDETHATQANKVAIYDEATWKYLTPGAGWKLWNETEGYYESFDGTVWAEFAAGGGGGTTLAALTDVDLTGLADGDVLVYDSGAGEWTPEPPASGGATTPFAPWTVPVAAAFTGVNLDASTFVDNAGGAGIVYTDPGAQGFETRGFFKALPAAPYNLYCRVDWSIFQMGNNDRIGPAIRNSANGKIIVFGVTTSADGLRSLRVDKWTTAPSYSASVLVFSQCRDFPNWFRIENDGTNIKWYWGNGYEWVQIWTETLATFIGTADEGGFSAQMIGKCMVTLNSFSTVAPAAGGGGPA